LGRTPSRRAAPYGNGSYSERTAESTDSGWAQRDNAVDRFGDAYRFGDATMPLQEMANALSDTVKSAALEQIAVINANCSALSLQLRRDDPTNDYMNNTLTGWVGRRDGLEIARIDLLIEALLEIGTAAFRLQMALPQTGEGDEFNRKVHDLYDMVNKARWVAVKHREELAQFAASHNLWYTIEYVNVDDAPDDRHKVMAIFADKEAREECFKKGVNGADRLWKTDVMRYVRGQMWDSNSEFPRPSEYVGRIIDRNEQFKEIAYVALKDNYDVWHEYEQSGGAEPFQLPVTPAQQYVNWANKQAGKDRFYVD